MNIKENIALGKYCVQDQSSKCVASKCMAWRFRAVYSTVKTNSIFPQPQKGEYDFTQGRCGLVKY